MVLAKECVPEPSPLAQKKIYACDSGFNTASILLIEDILIGPGGKPGYM